jgi:hypothetical protein
MVAGLVGRRLRSWTRALPEFARFASRALTGLLRTTRKLWRGRPGARVRRLERLNRTPLPNLHVLHPGARNLPQHQLGVRSIPIEQIAGTAVSGAAQRGSDFKPLPPFRTANWRGRMQRLRGAFNSLVILPPIDVVKYGGRYWVEDGHNRVAAGLELGQLEVDAAVTELVEPGVAPSPAPPSLAAVLSETADLRAAGAGRFSPTVTQSAGREIGLSNSDGPPSRDAASTRKSATAEGAADEPARG